MEDFNSEEDSDYTNYWRDWVGAFRICASFYWTFAHVVYLPMASTKSKSCAFRFPLYWPGYRAV